MTECERIIEQGILPQSFFDPETICDFYVDEKRKKIWAVELDLLLEFDRICKEYELKYYLSVGTLLGAVRHHGFIPWDDDIDVEMPREDYDRLQVLYGERDTPYFLQTPYTDSYYAFSHIRLVNLNTTCFTKVFAYQPMKQGIFLDIFPLDKWDEKDEVSDLLIDSLNRENSTYMRLLNPYLDEQDSRWHFERRNEKKGCFQQS